jgi:hypothetical protein
VSVATPGNVLVPKEGADGKIARFPDSLLARRQANGPTVPLLSRIKPPSDIRLLIGRRNSALPQYDKFEDRRLASSRAEAIQVDRTRIESGTRTIVRVSSADSQMRDFETHDSRLTTRHGSEASPKEVQIQKKLFAQADDVKKDVETPVAMYDTRNNVQKIPFKTSRSGHSQWPGEGASASPRNNAMSNILNEGGCEGMTASAIDSETPMMHSRHVDISPKFQQTSKPVSTNTDHISIYRVMEDKFPVSHLSINGSKIVRKHLSEEQPVKAALASFDTYTHPMKMNFNPLQSPEWSGRKESSYDHEAYELLSQARTELHDLKENWKVAVLASRSVAKMKLELSAAQESAKEVLELRNALSRAGDDKANLTAELRKVAMQYDLISQQLRESEARCRELRESRTKIAEEHEAARNELNCLHKADAARKSEEGKNLMFSSERVRGLENQVKVLESRVSAAEDERDDLTMECEDLRSFTETLQQAAADAEQVSKRAAFGLTTAA